MRVRSVVWLLAGLAAVAGLAGPAADAQDVEQLEQREQQLRDQVEESMRRLEELEADRVAAEEQLAELRDRRDELTARIDQTSEQLTERARHQFMHDSELSSLAAVVAADDPAGAAQRAALLEVLSSRDTATVESATALRTQLEQTRALLEDTTAELDALQASLRQETARLQAVLDATVRKVDALRARAARQRQIARGAQQGTYACIFDQGVSHFIDSWGAPRSGGRGHEGTDVMAPRGVNVYAITSGTIGRLSSGGLGGTALRIRGDDGNRYYYAHLQGFADGIRPGARVEAGQLVAFNGSSGNARGGATHVHLQVHPGGGAPVNPYPWLRAVCR